MRSLILSLFFVAFAALSFGQLETCADSQMPVNVVDLTPTPSVATTLTLDGTFTTNPEGYVASNLGAGFTVNYWSFTVDAMQSYTISVEGAAGSPVIGSDVNISLSTDCTDLNSGSEEIFADIVPANASPETMTCAVLAPGVTYTVAIAIDPALVGDIIINVVDATTATNVDCTTATALPGTSVGNNSCSSGLVWYSYTVVNGGSVSVSVSPTGTPSGITTPVIAQSILDLCTNTAEATNSWTCLPVGTVVYFQAGDDTAPIEQGDFNITITDDATGIANETCALAALMPTAAASCTPTVLTTANNTTVGACPDNTFSGCPVFNDENTVWYAFTTDANAQTVDVAVTGDTEFALIDGAAGCPTSGAPATAIGGCQVAGVPLVGATVAPSSTYYVAVATSAGGTDGPFTVTVTPQNPPANDDCALGAQNISATAAAGVDGTTACATSDPIDFCPAVTEDHVVYYTYTVDASITTNRTVTITTTTNTVTSGTAATSLGYGVFTDCAGTAYMNTPTTGDICDPLTAPIVYECVEPGTVLTIAVASTDMSEGDFNIMITEMATGTATNDICDLGSNPAIMAGTPLDGTNSCADGEIIFCGMTSPADHQVWYQYTNTTGGNVDLQLNIAGTGGNPATQISMLVLEGACGGTTPFAGTSATDYCDIIGTNVTIACIENNETIRIVLGSAEDASVAGPEGDFTITATELMMSPSNDECSSPTDITASLVNCTPVSITVDNTNACPEDFNQGGCTFDADATVWLSFTVPTNGLTHTLEIENINAGSYLGIWDAAGIDCDAPGAFAISSDCELGAGPHGSMYDDLVNGNTYLIAFANPAEATDHTFDIILNELPANDECMDAVVLSTTVSQMGTTTCATAEMTPYSSGECTPADQENTVWHEITVPAGFKGFDLTVSSSATNPITGDINAVLFETTTAGCVADGNTFVEEDCLTLGMLSQTFQCVGAGTYLIRISSSDANSGDFDIVFESLPLVQSNDECDMADATLNPGLECEWMNATADTDRACPENMNLDPDADCAIDEFPVVWYTVTSPAGAEFLDLRIEASPANRPFLAVFEDGVDCATLTATDGTDCFTGVFADLNALGEAQIDINPNTTYLIAVGSEDAAGSTINFGIKWIVPPANDECVDAVVLAGNTPTDGTTACATQAMGEYESGVCTALDETNTVWYEYTVPATDKGFNVTITGAGVSPLMGDINLVVFESTAAGCDASATTLIDEVCTAAGIENEFECIGEGTYVIRISTSADNEGDFQITIEPLDLVVSNDNCDNAINDPTGLNEGLECQWMTADAATVGACPEDMNIESGGCMMDEFPTVWYEVTAPATAEFLDLQIFGASTYIAVFDQGATCDMLVNTDGTDCFTGPFTDLAANGSSLIDVTPGNTYLIAVGLQNDNGSGSISFGIKWITPPDNDECADAELFDALAPTGTPGEFSQTYTTETTACATQDPPFTSTGCNDDFTNTVWYSYTVEADVKEITIDVTNYTTIDPAAIPDIALAVFMGCGSLNLYNQADGSQAEYCGGEGEDLLRFSCLEQGDVLTIMVSSSSANEGTFDITLNTAQPDCVYTNDECPDAILFADPVILDDPADCIPIPGCNDLACTEFDFGTLCPGLDALNTVFFTFTTDDLLDGMGNPVDAFVNLEVTNGQAGELDAPGAILFSGDCASPAVIGACAGTGGLGEFNSGPLGMPGQILPNTTYTVVVYNGDTNQNGGTFDLCITVSSGCVNDEACDAFTLEPGVVVDNPASSVGCTPDLDLSGCGAAQNEATLWYQIEIPEGAESVEITLANQVAPDGVTGDVSIAVGQLVDCNNISTDPADINYQECAGFGTHMIDCIVEYGIYYIQIGSEDDMEAGDFTIEYTFNSAPDPANDLCSDAQELVVTEYCMFQNFNGTLENACPELNDNIPCRFSDNPSVWYKITIPDPEPTVTTMDIRIDGMTNPNFGVYEFDCATVSDPSMGIVNTPVNDMGPVGCVQMDLVEGIEVTPGDEYYILVSSADMYEGTFMINIKLNAPPENDNPCITDINPPTDLTGGGSDMGSTCCATLDFANVDCSAATEAASVWYTFTPNEADDGYDITLAPGDIEGPTSLEIYSGPPNGGCTGALEVVASSCNSNSAMISIGNCFEPGEVLFIKVTSDDPDENCGTFTLSIDPASCGDTADDCMEAFAMSPITPTTTEGTDAPDYVCVTGCLTYACADAIPGCPTFADNPTTWHYVDPDDLAAVMNSTVEPNGAWEANWSVYGGTSCDDAQLLAVAGSVPCNVDDNTPELHNTPVLDAFTAYWVVVTVDPASLPPSGIIDDGSYELCVATTLTPVVCLGEENDCTDPSLMMEITDRSNDLPLDPDGDGLAGPFCPGEEVTVSISFTYDALGVTGNDWMIGLVPQFGEGWDLENFDYAANGPTGNGTAGEWLEVGGPCAPILQENVGSLCTYTDDDGVLRLCNTFCEACDECPEQGMMEGDPLPSGYFWTADGGAGCANDCAPGNMFGIGSETANITWDLTLTVKEFDTFEECQEMNSLQITFQTFSDGVAGCWEDPVAECLQDKAMFSAPWKIDCNTPPNVIGPPQEICDNGQVDILVQTEDGSNTMIVVEHVPNPDISGATSFNFTGSGTIDDFLDNMTDQVQVQVYQIYAVDPDIPCPGVINEIEVTIYPQLIVTIPPLSICEGLCTDITPTVEGGQGVSYNYLWNTGETTPSINVCPVTSTTYNVTVTDDLGCSGTGEREVIVRPALEEVVLPEIFVCKDQDFNPGNPDYIVCVDQLPSVLGGTPGYTFNWMAPSGLFGVPQGNCFAINEVTSSENMSSPGLPIGSYLLVAEVVDMFGCIGSVEVQVNVTGELTLVLDPEDVDCGETETTLTVTGLDNAGNPVPEFRLYGGCPADGSLGLLIDDAITTTGVAVFQSLDLEAFDCYTVVAVTASGCQTSQTITIPITQGVPIELSGDLDVCDGSSATISIDNFADYMSATWTPNIGTVDANGDVTFVPDSTATYTVNTVEANGCLAEEIWTITVNDAPVVDITGSPEFCVGSSATVTATGGVMYEWSNGGVTGPTYTSSTDGETVTVTVTDANGCTATASETFSEEPSITINLGNQDICDGMGDTVFVNNTYTNISWINTDDASEVSDTFFYVVTGAGSFEVSAIDPVGGCNAFGSFVVNDSATPTVSVPDTVNVCRLDSGIDSLCIDFVAQVTGAAGTWTQVGSIPGFTFSDFPLDEVCFEGIASGCYAFAYQSNTAVAPCAEVQDTMIVCVNPCPCPNPGTSAPPNICNVSTYNLEMNIVTTDPGMWSVTSGPATQDISAILTGSIFDANGVLPGVYELLFTLDNPGGPACTPSSIQTITVEEQMMIDTTGANSILCNISGQSNPTSLDLYDLITVDATDGGTWVQVGTGTTVTLTGPDGSIVNASDVPTSELPEVLTFEYTAGATGSVCPPDDIEVSVNIQDCNCPIIIIGTEELCNDGLPFDLTNILTNLDGLAGTWSAPLLPTAITGSLFDPMDVGSGAYEVIFTLDTEPNPGNGCPLTYGGEIIIRRAATAETTMGDEPCSVDTGNGPTEINLYTWLESGYTEGTWAQVGGDPLTINDNGIDVATVDFVTQDIGEMFMFEFTTSGATAPCMNITVPVTITVQDCDCPPIMIAPADPICNDAGMIDLCALTMGSDPGTFVVTSAGGTAYPERLDPTGCIFSAGAIGGGNPLAAGTYTITYTLDQTVTGTCTQSVNTTLEISNYLSTTIMDPAQVCNDPDGNGEMTVNFNDQVGNAGAGTWSDDDGSNVDISTVAALQSVSFIGVPAGQYNFTYTIDNADPCDNWEGVMTVTVVEDCNCPPISPDDPATVCSTDGPVDLTVYDDPTMPGTWSSDELTVNGGNSLVIDGVEEGTYNLTYTVDTPTPDCVDTSVVMITIGVPANAGTQAAAVTLCEGESMMVDLAGELTGADDGGMWTETSAVPSTGFSGATFDTDGQVPGTYTFQYSITNTDPCPPVDATVTVIINPNPSADAGGEKFLDCDNTSADLGGIGTSMGDGFAYTWTLEGDEIGTTASINVSNEGTYQLLVTNTNTGCADSATVVVNVSDALPTLTFDVNDITCNGDNDGSLTSVIATGGDGNYMYSLNQGAPVTDPASFTGLAPGDYTIEVIDGVGCVTPYPFTVVEPGPVSVDIAGDPILPGEPGDEFELTIDPVGANIDSIVWSDFNDPTIIYCSGGPEDCTTITVTPSENTTSVYVEVFDANGCSSNDQVQIQLNQIVDVTFPNIISPNGDGINDIFYVKSEDVLSVDNMQIFDRWGELLFEKKNALPRVEGEGWDGTFNDRPVVPGVYVFTVTVTFNDANLTTETISGDVTVTDAE